MDNTRYKSVAVPNQVHKILKHIAGIEGRTIGGQMSHIIREYNATFRGHGDSDKFGEYLDKIKMVDTIATDK
tara:strand:+ start:324 stop:539 length:216 start_codon:yes stop_codon:yes gene_type:complete